MKTYQVSVGRRTDSYYDAYQVFPCKDRATAISLKNKLRNKFLQNYPELLNQTEDEYNSWHIDADDDEAFLVSDDYCVNDFAIYVDEVDVIETNEDADNATEKCENFRLLD